MAEAIREYVRNGQACINHDRALELYRRYLILDGISSKVLDVYRFAGTFETASVIQREINTTYTVNMADPDNDISGVSAKRIWNSLSKQLSRAFARTT